MEMSQGKSSNKADDGMTGALLSDIIRRLRMRLSHPAAVQLLKYLVSGTAAAVMHFSTLIGLVEVFGVLPIIGSSVGFCAGTAVNYTLQYYWTFSAKGPHAVMLTRYLAVTFAMLLVNTAIFWVAHDKLGIAYIVAQLIATILVVMLNFQANRRYTFR